MNIAQISTDGTHQIVILPEDFQLAGTEVYIKKMGSAIGLNNSAIALLSVWLYSNLRQKKIDMREATFTVRIPADLIAYGFSEEQVQSQVREWLVLSLFTEDRISSGKAAQFLNLTRVEFLKLLQKRGISYLNYNSEELAEEFKSVETMELDRFQ